MTLTTQSLILSGDTLIMPSNTISGSHICKNGEVLTANASGYLERDADHATIKIPSSTFYRA